MNIDSPTRAREAGVSMIRQGFAGLNRGTIRPVHIQGAEWNTTLCNRTLSEPNRIGNREFLGQFTLCTACQRKLARG